MERDETLCPCTTVLGFAEARVPSAGDIIVCLRCGEPRVFDPKGDAPGFRMLTGLEFEDLPLEAVQAIAGLAVMREATAPPSYVRTVLELEEAGKRWALKRIADGRPLVPLTVRLPPDDEYVRVTLRDAIDRAAGDDAETREFLTFLDEATEGRATLSQLRAVLHVGDVAMRGTSWLPSRPAEA